MITNQLKENITQGWLFMLSGSSFRLVFIFSINSLILGVIQKVCSLETSSFWPPPSLVSSCSFYMYPSPAPLPTTYVRFSELPPPPLRESLAKLLTFISNKKLGGEKREKNYLFCKLSIKEQCFWHRYIYNNNTNIYIFIKKC